MKRLRNIAGALEEKGIPVYMPSSHVGVCTQPYCVVQFLGSYPASGFGTGYDVVRIHIYAPVGCFALLERLEDRVETAMLPLTAIGAVRPCDSVGACTVDDSTKALACYLDYHVQYGPDGQQSR